ncbi:alpha/beta hydrolase [Mangrovitalea sediminis]|uniref:alpha/beta hydrolase n=1 Tax=Mangrovitalea sediminis TaxID=1982043 RepID=UPI000BE59BA1|nr:alpha/beta fold hydrolase [Mangrovitalea sediminis]
MSLLPCVEIEPRSPADATVIWLHGLGADGHDFEPIVPELRLPESASVRFIFPHAPSIPVTINGGYVMPAWYDILEMDIERKIDERQILASADAIRAFIDREIERGIDSRRIIVAGFSQGGAVAYQVALTYPKRLGGLLALSTYFATRETIKPDDANRDLPIQVCHGSLDPVVPEILGRQSVERLQSLGYPASYKTYPMEHGVSPQEVTDIAVWLKARLSL